MIFCTNFKLYKALNNKSFNAINNILIKEAPLGLHISLIANQTLIASVAGKLFPHKIKVK
jgi:hypothetical protein